jgi:hypothetical protein
VKHWEGGKEHNNVGEWSWTVILNSFLALRRQVLAIVICDWAHQYVFSVDVNDVLGHHKARIFCESWILSFSKACLASVWLSIAADHIIQVYVLSTSMIIHPMLGTGVAKRRNSTRLFRGWRIYSRCGHSHFGWTGSHHHALEHTALRLHSDTLPVECKFTCPSSKCASTKSRSCSQLTLGKVHISSNVRLRRE